MRVKEYFSLDIREKFAPLVDLGIVVVPEGFKHDKLPNPFGNHFPAPTRILRPGDELRARAFKQTVGGRTTTSQERLAFLATQNAVLVGAQGAVLVLDQKRHQLPTDRWFTSYDKEYRLWNAGKDGYIWYKVPGLGSKVGRDFILCSDIFSRAWNDIDGFLCFTDVDS